MTRLFGNHVQRAVQRAVRRAVKLDVAALERAYDAAEVGADRGVRCGGASARPARACRHRGQGGRA